MNEHEILSHKALASAVISGAILDLNDKSKHRAAKEFLIGNKSRTIRGVWLAWLNLNDDGFQKMLRQPTFQGFPNKINLDGIFTDKKGSHDRH